MNRRIKSLLSLLALMLCQDGFATPDWIEQASRPGPNTASIGQSRFDELFLQALTNRKLRAGIDIIDILDRHFVHPCISRAAANLLDHPGDRDWLAL